MDQVKLTNTKNELRQLNECIVRFSKTFGPGILFASTAIGVSHLVQSTRAGAEYGFLLLGFVILATLLKYPFFEYGSRYANATTTSLIDGYDRLGKPALLLYFIITIASMFFVTAAVGFVTTGFLENLFQIDFLGIWTIVILFGVCTGVLIFGKYSTLDGLIKIIGTVLVATTVLAFVLAIINGPIEKIDGFEPPEIWNHTGIFFIIALMGWMPMPIDISSWHSLWTIARIKQTSFKPKLKETLLDFNLGYLFTGIIAIFFVTLGAYIFYGTGNELPNNNSLFAHSVVTLFTETIGHWSYLIIAASAFSIMFGTIIAVFDGYSRSLERTTQLLTKNVNKNFKFKKIYEISLFSLASGSLVVVILFENNLKDLVDFATIISFLIAPIIAIFNFRLVTGKYIIKDAHPPIWLKVLSYAGIIFLIAFAALFIITRL